MLEPFANSVRLICLALAVFRLTHLIWWEFGPWEIFWRLRERMGVRVLNGEGESEPFLWGDSFTGKLFACPLCLSMWIAGGLVALYLVSWQPLTVALDVFCLWLALAAVSLLLFGWERGE